MLREINPFAQSDLQMYRLVQEHPTTSVKMVFLEDKNLDMRRYPHSTLYAQGPPPVRTSREAVVSKGGRGGAKARAKDGHRKSNVRLN
ncbi:hypothetical protein AVEN_203678-1 [Araneus ventricosus]|uniref:Uncharacterized protein n=1 Tax=Araneus ventricosus TaxID=182803 RepID=A0A4Y2EWQ4_ARAVE|nr:hypothetical protein AVEN_203678-1 [Araneus ventricosus]